MPVQTLQGKWIDDDVADVILRLAKLQDDQDVFPKELIDQIRKAKDELGLIEIGLR